LTNLQISASAHLTNDITADAKKSAKFMQARKAKQMSDKLSTMKKRQAD
jgi:hypothetical protein